MNQPGTDQEAYTLNFWPSFADFMLALLLVLVFLIALVSSIGLDITEVAEKQKELALSEVFLRHGLARSGDGAGVVEWYKGRDKAIRFAVDANNPLLQRITFSDFVLFEPDESTLKQSGRDILRVIGLGIQDRIRYIEQIQIHGHADIRPSSKFQDNLELAAARAMTVFRFLQSEIKIDPIAHLMSATSFGEYVPVVRQAGEVYTPDYLRKQNQTEDEMRRNRRVELVLFYWRSPPALQPDDLDRERIREISKAKSMGLKALDPREPPPAELPAMFEGPSALPPTLRARPPEISAPPPELPRVEAVAPRKAQEAERLRAENEQAERAAAEAQRRTEVRRQAEVVALSKAQEAERLRQDILAGLPTVLREKGLREVRIRVAGDRSVTLEGRVDDFPERDLAISIAKNYPGVSSVVSQIWVRKEEMRKAIEGGKFE